MQKKTVTKKTIETPEREIVKPIEKNEKVKIRCTVTHYSINGIYNKGQVYELDLSLAENQIKNGVAERC